METIEVLVTKEHFKASPGYIFDDCPLKLALKQKYPDALILVGGKIVTIVFNKEKDEFSHTYQLSPNYLPIDVDDMIKIAKQDLHVELYVLLTYVRKEENLFLVKTYEERNPFI